MVILDIVIGCLLVAVGIGVSFGEMIAAFFSRDSVMEARDELQPVGAAPAPARVAVEAAPYPFRTGPYVAQPDPERTGPLPLDHTEPIQAWELPRQATLYESERAQLP